MSVTILRTVDSHQPDRRLREAVHYIICVLRLNYASACGESLKVTDTQHFLPRAKITVSGGSGFWLERSTFPSVLFWIILQFGIRSGEVTILSHYICQIIMIFKNSIYIYSRNK